MKTGRSTARSSASAGDAEFFAGAGSRRGIQEHTDLRAEDTDLILSSLRSKRLEGWTQTNRDHPSRRAQGRAPQDEVSPLFTRSASTPPRSVPGAVRGTAGAPG